MPVLMSAEYIVFISGENESVDSSNLIDAIQKAMSTIKEFKADRTKDDFVTKQFRDAVISLVRMYSFLIKQEESNERTNMLLEIAKYSGENETIKIFCNVCADILEGGKLSTYPGIDKKYIELLLKMLWYLITISVEDNSISCIIVRETRFLIKATEKLLEWKKHHLSGVDDMKLEEGGTILEMFCVVLHNILVIEGERGSQHLNCCIGAMKPYLESKDENIQLLCFATIAVLGKDFEFEILKRNAGVITFLKSAISKALEYNITHVYDGWSLVELARTVMSVATNDKNKRLLVEHGVVPLLVKMIGSEDKDVQYYAIGAIWQLSFDNDNRKDMIRKKEWNVVETLEKNVEHVGALPCLWRIKNFQTKSVRGLKKGRVVMMSFHRSNKDVVNTIRDMLTNSLDDSVKIWKASGTFKDDSVEDITESVENSDIVLVCYSSKYKDSLYKRTEIEYAMQLGKIIIPLNVEKDYKPDGWLHSITSSTVSYDFYAHLLEENVNVLIQAIKTHIFGLHKATEEPERIVQSDQKVQTTQKPHWHKCVKFSEISILQIGLGLMSVLLLLYCLLVTMWCCYNPSISCCYNPSISCCYNTSIKVCSSEELEPPSPTPIPGRPDEKEKTKKDPLTSQIFHSAMNWTLSQVEKWLKDKIIQKDMFLSQQKQLQKLRGKDVAFLKLLVRECPTTFYQTIREQLGMKDIQSMSDFRFALEDIETVQDSSSKHNTSTKALETEERSNV